jgi:hypothetical protein
MQLIVAPAALAFTVNRLPHSQSRRYAMRLNHRSPRRHYDNWLAQASEVRRNAIGCLRNALSHSGNGIAASPNGAAAEPLPERNCIVCVPHFTRGRVHIHVNSQTCKLFKKHNMALVGFWTPAGKEADKKLIYVLAFPSREAADKSWKAFRDDPDWKAAKAASEKDGTLVSKVESIFMNPTDYSPLK